MTEGKTFVDLVLPPSIVSKMDISRLMTELERVDADMTTADVHAQSGAQSTPVAPLSAQLNDFLTQNELQLDDGRSRSELIKQVRLLKDKAPVVHMTFAVIADPDSLRQLAQWLRTSIHPQAVIAVGLQPALVAGVYVRTPNHVKDLSLRAKLKASRGLLLKEVEALRGRV